ncbi:photosynthetic complex putative assembly protein PuhB [Parasphingorhabdus cellanae]|uniref:PH domain-containing protein n=1 Tax=Parasphingorhabdus cellanae TaxID=2806553 RepID=A0ABX7T6X7_9SPHN|nr:photosynthetic complex putative assembly protein PuhB [Parasphingorhabdus cellanae]QTD57351.1 PH domain-containing protein [Parasphingorhabdus cellanae]
MSEYDHEPVRGLPEELPEDEHIIWQDAPDWKAMVISALHIRLTVIYFLVIFAVAIFRGDTGTAIAMTALGATATGLFVLFAWGVGRTTIYTLTNKRVVLRIGVALNKCINLPLSEMEAANLKLVDGDHGNIALSLKGMPRLGYLMLWPHARSLRFVRPQPMLRAIPDAEKVARLLFEATENIQRIAPATETKNTETRNIPMEGLPA